MTTPDERALIAGALPPHLLRLADEATTLISVRETTLRRGYGGLPTPESIHEAAEQFTAAVTADLRAHTLTAAVCAALSAGYPPEDIISGDFDIDQFEEEPPEGAVIDLDELHERFLAGPVARTHPTPLPSRRARQEARNTLEEAIQALSPNESRQQAWRPHVIRVTTLARQLHDLIDAPEADAALDTRAVATLSEELRQAVQFLPPAPRQTKPFPTQTTPEYAPDAAAAIEPIPVDGRGFPLR